MWLPFQGALCAIPGRSTVAIPGARRPFHGNHKPGRSSIVNRYEIHIPRLPWVHRGLLQKPTAHEATPARAQKAGAAPVTLPSVASSFKCWEVHGFFGKLFG